MFIYSTVINNCIYDFSYSFSEGIVAVELNDKWGMIDVSNNTVIPFDYEKCNFMNCHASYIVNFNYVKSINDKSFIMKNDEIIPISDEELPDFLEGEETKTVRPALVRGGKMLSKGLAQLKYGEEI